MPFDLRGMKQTFPTGTSPKSAASGLVLIGLLVATTGCGMGKGDRWKFASWDVRRAVGLKGDKPDPETPTRLVTTWTEAVHNRTGETPKRGFGGRLAFFKNGSEDPVRVEGQLVIYAFDESGDDPYKTEPTKRYIFPAEQLSLHESESKLGPGYNIWLPWDEAGGFERKVSLIARFEPKDGPIIVGEQTKHLLSGIAKPGAADAEAMVGEPQPTPASSVDLARYQASSTSHVGPLAAQTPSANQRSILTPATTPPDPLATTSIPLPRKVSATPAPSLWANRVQQPTFSTPQMPSYSMSPSSQAPLQQSPSPGYTAQAVWQSPATATAGYLQAAPLPGPSQTAQSAVGPAVPGQPPSAGYQSAQPPALTRPFGR
jgi:hypothetical protein